MNQITVTIHWEINPPLPGETPSASHWVDTDHVYRALHAYFPNTTFKVAELIRPITAMEEVDYKTKRRSTAVNGGQDKVDAL